MSQMGAWSREQAKHRMYGVSCCTSQRYSPHHTRKQCSVDGNRTLEVGSKRPAFGAWDGTLVAHLPPRMPRNRKETLTIKAETELLLHHHFALLYPRRGVARSAPPRVVARDGFATRDGMRWRFRLDAASTAVTTFTLITTLFTLAGVSFAVSPFAACVLFRPVKLCARGCREWGWGHLVLKAERLYAGRGAVRGHVGRRGRRRVRVQGRGRVRVRVVVVVRAERAGRVGRVGWMRWMGVWVWV